MCNIVLHETVHLQNDLIRPKSVQIHPKSLLPSAQQARKEGKQREQGIAHHCTTHKMSCMHGQLARVLCLCAHVQNMCKHVQTSAQKGGKGPKEAKRALLPPIRALDGVSDLGSSKSRGLILGVSKSEGVQIEVVSRSRSSDRRGPNPRSSKSRV